VLVIMPLTLMTAPKLKLMHVFPSTVTRLQVNCTYYMEMLLCLRCVQSSELTVIVRTLYDQWNTPSRATWPMQGWTL